MIFTYKELKQKYSRRKIENNLTEKIIYKIEKGYYSDVEHYNHLELLVKKHHNAIFTSESAFYYWGLTDYIPEKEFLATKQKATIIKDKSISQIFSVDDYYNVGKTTIDYNGVTINIYDKERMLIELARNKNTLSYDYYKEIVQNYRNIVEELDLSKLAKYLKIFKNGDNIFETIHREVF